MTPAVGQCAALHTAHNDLDPRPVRFQARALGPDGGVEVRTITACQGCRSSLDFPSERRSVSRGPDRRQSDRPFGLRAFLRRDVA
jgi:hypothetical protein